MDVGSTQKTVALDAASASKKPGSVAMPASPVAIEAEQPKEPVDKAQVEVAAVALKEFAQSVQRDLDFSVDDGSGQVVVKVTDSNSGDVIRQIPSEEALQLAENLSDVRSLLFKAEA
jgi:flagellar protein FlaG